MEAKNPLLESGPERQGPKLLLFDFGGVLIEWEGVQPLLDLTNYRITAEQARRFWLESEWVREFERGRCSPEDFASGVISELELGLNPAQFIEAFLTWDRGPVPGAIEILERLKGKIPLACLSNNNILHWTRLQKEYDILQFFQHCFVSHEIGLVKPDRSIFVYILSKLPYKPGEILFFDDNPENVEAANRSGIPGCQTKGIKELNLVLEKLGF
jgi:putative hydrolase of the HAD superfamily